MVLEPTETDDICEIPTPTKVKRTMPELNILPAKKRRIGDFTEAHLDEPQLPADVEIVDLD